MGVGWGKQSLVEASEQMLWVNINAVQSNDISSILGTDIEERKNQLLKVL